MLKKTLWICGLLFCLTTLGAQSYKVESPDNSIALTFLCDEKGNIFYDVTVEEQPFINVSKLGFSEKKIDLSQGFHVADVSQSTFDETWSQPWGENKQIRNHYNELKIKLQQRNKTMLTMTFRCFDEGVAFRYAYDVEGVDSLLLMDELTEFQFAQNGTCWSIPAEFNSYEFLYTKQAISALDNANTPLTFKLESGLYGSIHEAALMDFPEMTLYKSGWNLLHAVLAPWPDGVRARFKGGYFQTPWRTIQIGRQAVDLINSSMILNLNEPCAITGDLSWIRPMKYVGIWWGMHLGVQSWTMDARHGATTANAKRYIDFAAKNHVDAVLFEGWNQGWETWGGRQNFDFTRAYADFDVASILKYAQQRNVSVIMHHETGGNMPHYDQSLSKCYRWLDSLGVHCVKTGYAGGVPGGQNHHGQYGVQHYQRVVDTAAKYHCMLDVHEPIKPTGLHRTYPNLMTGEGVRGMEWNAWSDGNPPSHQEILPFTRMLAGPMDYTPGTFDILFDKTRNSPLHKSWNSNDKGDSRVHTTLAKQLADWVIFYSPLQMASDMIENYIDRPEFQFFRDYNPDCDWSKALYGEIGEYVVVARRAGDTFFVGATTNEEARVIDLPLNFLPEGKMYTATIYADASNANYKKNPTACRILTRQNLSSKDVISIRMVSGGGQAIVFKTFSPEK